MSKHSGTIHVTWAQCPNRDCQSREWRAWDVDFKEDEFWCGTCETPLGQPIFYCPADTRHKCKAMKPRKR